jgi:predicted TIM-barrel fold metal-dependent hydrolase
VWRAAEGATPGVTTLVPPQTDVPIERAGATLKSHGIARAVLVQPVFRGEDNDYVAGCARNEPDRFAAVCVVDPRATGADERLESWVARGCRGLRLRPRIAGEAAVFGNRSTFPLWEAAERLGVVVSVLCGVEHIPTIGQLAERFPRVPIVIDHLAHPDTAAGVRDAGFQYLLALARHDRVFVKVSGFYHFTNTPYPFCDCWELIRAVYDRFGPTRLIWGSDFPHVEVQCGYGQSIAVVEQALRACSAQDLERILGLNALELYWAAAK